MFKMRQVYPPPPPPMLKGAKAIAKFIAVVALVAGAGAALLVAGVRPAGAQMPVVIDYDVNDNGLIEVGNLDQLNAMRWDLDGDGDPAAANTSSYLLAFPDRDTATSTLMGCPSGNCAGYELTADLTFPAETSSPYNPWTPIGTFFVTTFDGNGHTLTGLTVTSGFVTGLFGFLGGGGVIRDLGIINADVSITSNFGGSGVLAGIVQSGGRVYSSYALGGSVTVAASDTTSGGLTGANLGEIRASYATAAVATAGSRSGNALGGLTGALNGGRIIASYAAGAVSATGSGDPLGGLVGSSRNPNDVIANSYCDTEAARQNDCVGEITGGSNNVAVAGKTTAELQSPTRYCDIYENWNVDLDGVDGGDNPWHFGESTDYPRLYTPAERLTAPPNACDSPPPGGPRYALAPQDTPYDPAVDHPEVYVNDRWEMAVDCEVRRGADGEAEGSLIRFDLGSYQGAVILHLAVWNGEFFMSYESQDIAMPPFEREGQLASVRVVTDPGETRFLLDGVSPTRNLVLGYADCHTDDPGAASADSSESAATSTAVTSTPAAPRVYGNERYGMTAACEVQRGADGEADGAMIRFDLGSYEGAVMRHLSLWNGEYYASYESLGIDVPLLEWEGQLAGVRVATDPAQTRFLLDGVGPTTNLVLGYADCHTAGG